jgi:hypothetical protein
MDTVTDPFGWRPQTGSVGAKICAGGQMVEVVRSIVTERSFVWR